MAPRRKGSSGCIQTIRDSLVKVEENGRKAVFENAYRQQIRRIRVDECLVRLGPRCDWILSSPDIVDVLIELKGTDSAHACAQLISSAQFWVGSADIGSSGKIGALIVCSQYPRFDRSVRKTQEHFARVHKARLAISSRNQQWKFEDFASIGGL